MQADYSRKYHILFSAKDASSCLCYVHCMTLTIPLGRLALINVNDFSSYLTIPFAAFPIESTALPNMRMYTKEPASPTAKLKKSKNHQIY